MSFFDTIENTAPDILKEPFHKLLEHPGTPWFFLGAAVEALSTIIYFVFVGSAYPVIDFVVGTVFGIAILYYQEVIRRVQ